MGRFGCGNRGNDSSHSTWHFALREERDRRIDAVRARSAACCGTRLRPSARAASDRKREPRERQSQALRIEQAAERELLERAVQCARAEPGLPLEPWPRD